MKKLVMVQALNQAMHKAMAEDDRVFMLGLDISTGSMGVSLGLQPAFGAKRIIDCPAAESGYVGACVGAAITGLRPIAEIQFADFVTYCMDSLVNQAPKMHYWFGEKQSVPITFRLPGGSGGQAAAQHSQNFEGLFTHIPGLKVVIPSTPRDARGLLLASIRDDNPVVFFENKFTYGQTENVEDDELENFDAIPLGVADVKRPGSDVTIVATGAAVMKALTAAEELKKEGIQVEVIDPRTLYPLDKETIYKSVAKTGRLLVVTEEHKRGAWSAEMAALVAEDMYASLKAPIVRIGALNTPHPFVRVLEEYVLPQVCDIVAGVKSIC